MDSRRRFLKGVGAASTIGLLAGCVGDSGDDSSGDDESSGDDSSGDDGSSGDGQSTATPQPYENGTVNFNVSPSVAQEDLEAQYTPIKNHLSETLGFPAEMQLANNYSAVIQALDSGTSNLAETGPFAAALGVKSDKAEIILQRQGYGSWTYKSGIAIPQDSDIEQLSDLEGETIAFSDRLSTSGALFPLYALSTEGGLNVGELPAGSDSGADFDANFAGSHPASYETMANGQAAAAAFGGFVPGVVDDWDNTAEWLHTREGLPRAPIVVSPELSGETKQNIVDAFLEAPNEIYWGTDGEKGTDDDLWFNDVRKVGVDKYQPVIDVANELGVGQDIFEQA